MEARPDFLEKLKSSLPKSSYDQRKMWAIYILEKNIDLKELAELLKYEKVIATKFLWMLSDIGILSPNRLLSELSYLFTLCSTINQDYKTYFASYWLYVGVPSENEGEAIDLLFQFIVSPKTNITVKSRSALVLFNLTKKYPELKNELRYSLIDQLNKYSKDFDKRVARILKLIDE
ncbi:MAG TPA: hypothetical protein PKD18_08495 [Saprospiraceae bacterium]|nr:hypothetical protein [Saprospiraceae bacterium]